MAAGLVIFDCDGVLVDSEPISLAVTLDVLAEAGVSMTEMVGYENLLGRSLATNAKWIEAKYGLALNDDHVDRIRQKLYARFRAELAAIPGVADAIRALNCAVCVASSSQPDRIRLSLSLTGLLDLFEPDIFSATMVARGKPAPDLFLHAAFQMGFAPEDCTVVEDSPAGIRAARAAGMRVVAFTGGSHAGPAGLPEVVANLSPDAIIDRMAELPGAIFERS